ncbi:hypothetical protein B0H10DRAFT_1950641 [Mycena sp. CBHHK59/15]|nr:hypothetical protein B0H10DRAFT_1950641 [Mycena sp. CBHHK59/15]
MAFDENGRVDGTAQPPARYYHHFLLKTGSTVAITKLGHELVTKFGPPPYALELWWTSGFHPSGFATGRRAVTTGRDPSVQYFTVRFRRPGTGRVDPSTGHPLPVRRRVDGSTKDRVNQRRDDGVLWRIGKAAITAGFPSIRQDEFQLWE